MIRRDVKRGLATLCIGSMGIAMCGKIMEISKPYKGKGKRKIKKMPYSKRLYSLLCFLLVCNYFYLFSLQLIFYNNHRMTMELPVINHPDYVAKINDDNKFPIKKFGL